MRLLLLVLLLPSLPPAVRATGDPSDCASSLQLQDTVRSSLRSEDNAQALHRLVADHRENAAGTLLMLQQLRSFMETAVAEQRTALEKAVAEQKTAANTAAAEQKSAAATAAAVQKASLDMALAVQRATAEKVAAEQQTAAEKVAAEQQTAAEKVAEEQKTASSMATFEMRLYTGVMATLLLTAGGLVVYNPQCALAMLRAYIGPQHLP